MYIVFLPNVSVTVTTKAHFQPLSRQHLSWTTITIPLVSLPHTFLILFLAIQTNIPYLAPNIVSSATAQSVVWLRVGRPRGRTSSPGRVKNFLFATSSRRALGSSQPLANGYRGEFSPGVKRPGREAVHSPPTSAQVKKTWISTIRLHGVVFNSLRTDKTLPFTWYCIVLLRTACLFIVSH
jgi:hypothetical protein